MEIISHIVFDTRCSFRKQLKEQIDNAISVYPDLSYTLSIDKIVMQHNRYFVKFTIELDGNFGDDDTITAEIFKNISALNASGSKTGGVMKFYDAHQLKINTEYYSKVYETEMRIREALFYIFWNKFGDQDMYSFLNRFGGSYNEVSRKDFSNTFDHPLFYIMFSKYNELTKFQNLNTFNIPSKIDGETKYLFKEIKKYRTIDDLVMKLKSIWVEDSKHNAFLSELSSYLDAVELLRNAIAHNRHIEQDVINNADTAMQRIEILINDFWSKEESTQGLDTTSKEIVEWFLSNYMDPANGVPYDGSEGGYLYINGGPYYASDEIYERYPEVDDDVIEAAVAEIELECDVWVKNDEY